MDYQEIAKLLKEKGRTFKGIALITSCEPTKENEIRKNIVEILKKDRVKICEDELRIYDYERFLSDEIIVPFSRDVENLDKTKGLEYVALQIVQKSNACQAYLKAAFYTIYYEDFSSLPEEAQSLFMYIELIIHEDDWGI